MNVDLSFAEIQCPLLPALAHGKVRCSDWNNFQSKCSYLCDDGYRVPSGQNGVRVCGYTGHWRGGTPVCQDYERPVFRNCPVNRIAHTAKLSDYGVANWSDPDVTDNSDKAISVTWTGPSPGTALAVGTHRVTYNARDSAGNMAYPCSFTVNVRRLTCPVIYGKPYQRVSCPMGHRYGAMCHLSCDEGKNLTGKHNVSCELDSEYPPLTSWTWDLSQPKCEGSPCHPLQPPANGSLACDYWLYGRFCQMYCQEGTDLPRGSDDVGRLLVCNNNGEWTYKKKLPPCKKTRRPKKLRLLTELQYYTGDCCANDTQRRIRDVFVAQLNSSDYNQNNGVCYPPDCRVENVNVRCNPPCDGSSRHKRDIPVAIVEVSRTLDVMSNMSTQDNIQVATNLVSRLTDSMETQFAKVSLDVDMRFKSSEGRKPQMVCDDGLLPSATTLGCVPCSPGHFLNQTLSNCQPCPTGSYREDVAVLHCSPCPAGTTTRGLGTERREECLPQCSPGSYSSNGGLQPCTLCSVGTFTDETGAAQCRPCPPGTTTADEGSSQHALCKAFDVVFIPSAFQQHVSMTTSVTSQPEEVTLSLKLRLADGQNGSDWAEVVRLDYIVNRTSTTETVIRVAIATVNESQVIVEAHGCKVVSSGSTSMTQWQSISVSLNRTALVLCQNGDVFVNTDACKAPHDDDTENNTSAMRVTLGKQTDEAFFGEVTDVNVWDKTLTGSEIESATASCGHAAQGNVVSWRDMSMADLVGTSTQIPSLCDVTDDCAPAPCGNHTCVDKLGGYDCRCDDGFTGRHCQVNIDDCTDNACENNATCVDGVASYTCLCRESFYGNFCEHEIINGGWGDWGDWSQCSRSCGGGNTTRHRLCDSPPPDADGRPCDSDSEEWQECHTEECPVCGELQPPDHGSVNCSDGEEAINCTAVCDDGYEFSIESLDYYYCGPDTANRWSHQTEDNPHARIPDCAEMILPEKLTVQHSVQYADAPCNAKDVRAGVEARALEILALVPCIENGTCVMADLSARCISSDGHQGEQPPLTLTIALSVSDDEDKGDEANSTQEDAALGLLGAVEDLKTAVKVLQDRVEAGNFTVDVGGVEYIVAGQNVTGHASCALGMTRVSIVCVACSEGTYSRDEVCNKCPFGFYQDESQQTACKACPDGFKTMGTGSKTRQECVTCSPGTYEKNHGCEKCPVGFYQDLPAQTSCKACPPGYVSVDVGMEHATECNVTMAVTIASTDEPIQDNDINKLAAGAASALGVVIGAVAGVIALVIIAVVVIVFIVKQCRR
ncbi:hypothetical protein LSAT2_030102 [Lamellibrachia satsuma]|nr:hypothetical protein LSAT2_030102 [Lamellibrachia satsuma]